MTISSLAYFNNAIFLRVTKTLQLVKLNELRIQIIYFFRYDPKLAMRNNHGGHDNIKESSEHMKRTYASKFFSMIPK